MAWKCFSSSLSFSFSFIMRHLHLLYHSAWYCGLIVNELIRVAQFFSSPLIVKLFNFANDFSEMKDNLAQSEHDLIQNPRLDQTIFGFQVKRYSVSAPKPRLSCLNLNIWINNLKEWSSLFGKIQGKLSQQHSWFAGNHTTNRVN